MNMIEHAATHDHQTHYGSLRAPRSLHLGIRPTTLFETTTALCGLHALYPVVLFGFVLCTASFCSVLFMLLYLGCT